MSGNTNPFDPAHLVSPGADIEASLAIAGYGRTFTLFGRGALVAVLLPMGRHLGRGHRGGPDPVPDGPRLRRPDRRGRHQPDRAEGAGESGRRAALRAGLLARPDRRPGGADRRVRRQPVAEHRPEPVVRARRRADRLAARSLGAGAAHDARIPARRLALRKERRFRRPDARDRSALPARRAPDARLHRAPLGLARRLLVQGRRGDHRRRRGREARQPGDRADARLPDQRQPRPHRRLQVDRQRQAPGRHPDGRLHGLAAPGALRPARRGGEPFDVPRRS